MLRKTKSALPDSEELSVELENCRNRTQFLQEAATTLACFLKEFAFDSDELNVQDFRTKMDSLAEELRSMDSAAPASRAFEKRRKQILDFLKREREYLDKREGEFKDTIDLLLKGLSELSDHDRNFNLRMHESNSRLEEITRINEIAKIREGLREEINRTRDMIRKKQSSDAARMDLLTREVQMLRSSLRQAQDASMTDELTGASNRNGLNVCLSRCIDRSIVTAKPLSVLMLDIDDFKQINDTHGHPVGDVVLKRLVEECRKNIRSDDPIGRYGGEEFLIVLPSASLRNAMKKAKALCGKIAAKRYLVEYRGLSITIGFTISIGVSELRMDDTIDSLIERADEALYVAKRTGKNRAVSEKKLQKAA